MSIVPFHTPTTFLLAGPSQCGKSTWIRQLIESKDVMFTQPPKKVIYAYSAWQPMFEEMKGVEFHKGLPTCEEMESWSDLLLVLDDVMQAACLSEEVLSLFCVQSHHRNITAAILMQNLFPPGRFGRTISLNCHVITLFPTKRDKLQVQVLGRQMFPGQSKYFAESYEDATSQPYGYLVCDLHPASDEHLQLRTRIFPGEHTWVYQRLHKRQLESPQPFDI